MDTKSARVAASRKREGTHMSSSIVWLRNFQKNGLPAKFSKARRHSRIPLKTIVLYFIIITLPCKGVFVANL